MKLFSFFGRQEVGRQYRRGGESDNRATKLLHRLPGDNSVMCAYCVQK